MAASTCSTRNRSSTTSDAETLLPFGGLLTLRKEFISPDLSVSLFDRLVDDVDWKQPLLKIMGQTVPTPRLVAFFGTSAYTYSGQTHDKAAIPGYLAGLNELIAGHCTTSFNSILLNKYRNGRDGIGWHSDNEKSLGTNPVIASLSLGATRRFSLRHKQTGERVDLALASGDLLVMNGSLQRQWQHSVPKTRRHCEARISLTFRRVFSERYRDE